MKENLSSGFPIRFDTNQTGQSQKIARGLKISDLERRGIVLSLALISFAVTANLICVFVFAYAKSWFSHNEAQFRIVFQDFSIKHMLCNDQIILMSIHSNYREVAKISLKV